MRYKGEITVSAIIILLCVLIYGVKGVNDKLEEQNLMTNTILESFIYLNTANLRDSTTKDILQKLENIERNGLEIK